jgi:acylphosphatase
MSNEEREVKRLRIRGTVHGVGYRVWVEREALALGLKGWVRNRRDGSVEVIAGGPPAAVAQRQSPLFRHAHGRHVGRQGDPGVP